MTDMKAAVDTARWFTPFKMVSEDPLRYELYLGTEEVTFDRITGLLREQGWVEESRRYLDSARRRHGSAPRVNASARCRSRHASTRLLACCHLSNKASPSRCS